MNKIFLIGDSTCQTNTKETYPQVGWGQFFSMYLKKDYEVINLAKNGRSTKSFIDEGLFKYVEDNISNGDYLFIQFGHNDEKEDKQRHTDKDTTYKENLEYFINTARNNNATPILLSSIYRRKFEGRKLMLNNHLGYPEAMKEVAIKNDVYFIDLTTKTYNYINDLGPSKSKGLFMYFYKNRYKNYPEGSKDNTHLRSKGAKLVCEMIIEDLLKDKELKKLVK